MDSKKKSYRSFTKSKSKSNSKDEPKLEMRDIVKEINLLNASHMTWKEKKEAEMDRIISLGGKPVKRQRLPLSVARVQMKKQQEKQQKFLEKRSLLEKSGVKVDDIGSNRRKNSKRATDRLTVWRSDECHFKNGALIVKNVKGSTQHSADKVMADQTQNNRNKHSFSGKMKGRGKK